MKPIKYQAPTLSANVERAARARFLQTGRPGHADIVTRAAAGEPEAQETVRGWLQGWLGEELRCAYPTLPELFRRAAV